MCVFNPSHSKILFNLWGWLWQSDHRSDTLSWEVFGKLLRTILRK
ncbi:hypothetical protein LEP1GSC057_0440 [Leptospira interrogans str. Brem 329]|nr:hypothetical protein LEP1GSC057_0440 [Leptospira interrogans str. Brem 329]